MAFHVAGVDMKKTLFAVALLVFCCSAAKADGVDDLFTLQFLSPDSGTIYWQLPASPMIPPVDASSVAFIIPDLTYWFNGGTSTWDEIVFYTSGDGGHFRL